MEKAKKKPVTLFVICCFVSMMILSVHSVEAREYITDSSG